MKKFIVLAVVLILVLCLSSIVSARSANVIKVTSAHGFNYLWESPGGTIPQYMGNNTWQFTSDFRSDITADVELFFKIYPCLEIEKILYSDEKMMIIKVMGTM
ncbi:MAG: hypothetical protein WC933_00605 [Candidatus Paceibacterota bacterium]|jgi:hypothetical protein